MQKKCIFTDVNISRKGKEYHKQQQPLVIYLSLCILPVGQSTLNDVLVRLRALLLFEAAAFFYLSVKAAISYSTSEQPSLSASRSQHKINFFNACLGQPH
jgi:hypothetical protein